MHLLLVAELLAHMAGPVRMWVLRLAKLVQVVRGVPWMLAAYIHIDVVNVYKLGHLRWHWKATACMSGGYKWAFKRSLDDHDASSLKNDFLGETQPDHMASTMPVHIFEMYGTKSG